MVLYIYIVKISEERIDSKLTNKYGEVLLRGNNVLFVHTKYNQK